MKAVIKSNIGGNLRLRVPNALKLNGGSVLKKAMGQNVNQFYQTEETPAPIISPNAKLLAPEIKETWLYDLPTSNGGMYVLIRQ
jgi:alpha-L-fucosidase 2